jgi:cytidylate kinase
VRHAGETMAERRFAVAVDGPSGAGKSTASRGLARRLGFRYVDTGAMYRAVAFLGAEAGIDRNDADRLGELAATLAFEFVEAADATPRVLVGGRDVTAAIRQPEVSQMASAVSAHPQVRRHLVSAQRVMAAGCDVVMEGRDIGTVVLPDAQLKVFVTAAAEVRAERRSRELAAGGIRTSAARVESEHAERDARDSSRATAPLRPADDAVVMDTSALSLEEVIDAMERLAVARGATPRS